MTSPSFWITTQQEVNCESSSINQAKIPLSYQRFVNQRLPLRLLLRCRQAQQEHDDAKEMFELLNESLIAEIPQLLDLRVPYFDPSFEAMIRMQAKFAEEGYEKLSGVQRYEISLRRSFLR
jgi:BAR domain